MASVSVVVVTFNALPWIERALESVRGHETIVVDHGSTDGTLELVRERFPEARLIEQENKGLGSGSNTGMRVASGAYFLLLNSDAWALDDAVERLAAFADEHPEAAVVGPRLLQPGRLAPAFRARVSRRVAARDRVPLPAQAGAALPRIQLLLRRAASTMTRCGRPSS